MLKMITLMTSDNQTFEVKEEVAMQSQTIKHWFDDRCADEDSAFPLPNVTGATLSTIITYCQKHAAAGDNEDLKSFDADFVKVDQAKLYDLTVAANYLNIEGLLHLTTQKVADMCKGKQPEEIRKTFNIKNDFSPAEEEEIRKQNQWAFE